jgi:NAD(P)H-dependent FMN reductase
MATTASIYDGEGNTITGGLQPASVCDEAIQAARRIAAESGDDVYLEDDDGNWIVSPDGTSRKARILADGMWVG